MNRGVVFRIPFLSETTFGSFLRLWILGVFICLPILRWYRYGCHISPGLFSFQDTPLIEAFSVESTTKWKYPLGPM